MSRAGSMFEKVLYHKYAVWLEAQHDRSYKSENIGHEKKQVFLQRRSLKVFC